MSCEFSGIFSHKVERVMQNQTQTITLSRIPYTIKVYITNANDWQHFVRESIVDVFSIFCPNKGSLCSRFFDFTQLHSVPLLSELPLTLALFVSLAFQLLSELLNLYDIALCCSLVCLQQFGLVHHLQLLQLLLVLGDQLLDLWLQAWTCIREYMLYKSDISKDLGSSRKLVKQAY